MTLSHHLIVLLQSGNHNNDATPLLPNHVPEVTHGVQHRPLGGNIGPRSSFVALQEEHCISGHTSWTKVKKKIKSTPLVILQCKNPSSCTLR